MQEPTGCGEPTRHGEGGADDTLAEFRDVAAELAGHPIEQLCDELLSRFAAEPSDDVCLLAVRTPLGDA